LIPDRACWPEKSIYGVNHQARHVFLHVPRINPAPAERYLFESRRKRSLFHGFSKHAHFLTPRAPMIGVISQHAGQRWWVAIGH
jgi:hypothetical protein